MLKTEIKWTYTHTIIWGYNNGSVGNSILLCKHEDLNLDPQHGWDVKGKHSNVSATSGMGGGVVLKALWPIRFSAKILFQKTWQRVIGRWPTSILSLYMPVCANTHKIHTNIQASWSKRQGKNQEDVRKNGINGK